MDKYSLSSNVVRDIYNNFLLAHTIYALDKVGHLDHLLENKGLQAKESNEVLVSLLNILSDNELVTFHGGSYLATDLGVEVFKQRGFFVWCIGGYGNFYSQLKDILLGNISPKRDEAEVAIGSSLIDQTLSSEDIEKIVMAYKPNYIADLGCGNGSRICKWITKFDNIFGLGIEKSEAAVSLALQRIRELSLEDRVSIINADCMSHIEEKELSRVDCVTCFFLLHDLMNSQHGDFSKVVNAIEKNFPSIKFLILADTVKTEEKFSFKNPAPVFTRGFELVHSIMATPLYSLDQYKNLLCTPQFRLVDVVDLAIPNSYVFVLQKKDYTKIF